MVDNHIRYCLVSTYVVYMTTFSFPFILSNVSDRYQVTRFRRIVFRDCFLGLFSYD